MKRVKLSLFIGLLIVMMLLTACGGGSQKAGGEGSSRDSLTMRKGEPITLDPQYTDVSASQSIIMNINETLVKYDYNKEEFLPMAAEKWEISEDGKEYTFYLSKGNKFHNGNELKADDVKFTFNRAADSPYTTDIVKAVKGIEVVDDYTVKIELKYAYSPFMSYIASAYLSLVNEESVKAAGDDYGRNPVGTGSYKIVEWINGEKMKLEAYEDYHLGAAPIKNINLVFVEDQSTAVIALENGEFDLLDNVPPVDKKHILDNESLIYDEAVLAGMDYLILNNELPHFSDKKVRQAFACSLDLENILDILTEGSGYVADGVIPPGVFGFDPSVKRYPKDIEKAKDLLAEAGYPEGFKTKIMVNEETGYRVAQVVQANLKDINIDCEIEMLEYGKFLDLQANGGYEMSFNGYGFFGGDADTGLYPLLHSSKINSTNPSRYSNPKVDKLLDQARTEVNREKRAELYSELSNIVHEELPLIPLDVCTVSLAGDKDLQGVKANPMALYYFSDYSWK